MKKLFVFISFLFFSFNFSLVFTESVTNKKIQTITKSKSLTKNEGVTKDKHLTAEKSITEDKSLTDNKTITGGADTFIGSAAITVSNNQASVTNNAFADITYDTEFDTYTNDYGRWLKVVNPQNENARFMFSKYFSDWQWSNQESDFFSYSANCTMKEEQIELCYDEAVKKFGIGTAIIATTWIVAFAIPGGSIYHTAILIIAKATTEGAVFGGAIGGITSCGIALFQGKTGNELMHSVVNGASDGYLVGAVSGLVVGTGQVYKMANEIVKFKSSNEIISIYNNKVYDCGGNYLGKFKGEISEINGRSIINKELVGTVNANGIKYKWMLADDGEGNFFKVVNPDFTNVKIVDKVYTPPKRLWSNTELTKNWCQQEYLKDLADENVENILGISKKEAAMRLQFERGKDLRDSLFLKENNIKKTYVRKFLKRYSGGAWHHLPSSGELIYVPKNHNLLAPHTGGDSFWGSKLTLESIEW